MGPYSTRNQPSRGGNRWGSAGPAGQTPPLSSQPLQSSANRGAHAMLDLAVDSLKLADLQIQVLSIDVRRFWSGAWTSLLVLVAGAALLTAALPVAMFGLAEYLRQSMSLSIEFALLLVSGAALAIAGGLMAWSALRLSAAATPLKRSAEELRENLRWMRGLLHNGESTPKDGAACR